jgi:hypothetical protein
MSQLENDLKETKSASTKVVELNEINSRTAGFEASLREAESELLSLQGLLRDSEEREIKVQPSVFVYLRAEATINSWNKK